jgi:hypothetical protein
MTKTTTENTMAVATMQSGELATAAMAAKAKAQIEARYVIAYNRPRSILQARSDILAACNRPGFAESARYKKPVGNTTIDGFSIRFAEEAIKALKNISVETTTIYEDESKRTVQVNVTDLENNVNYGKEITVAKTVERKALKAGQAALSKRLNSYGQIVYLVEATEDDIANKIASAESKIIRNCGLRLIPSDILEEAEATIEKTLNEGGVDIQAGIKKITDAFASLNISVAELEKYLKHTLSVVSPKELKDLRAIYSAIKDGESSWSDYTQEQPKQNKPDLSNPSDETKQEIIKAAGKIEVEQYVEEQKEPVEPAQKSPQLALSEFLQDAGIAQDVFINYLNVNQLDKKAGFETSLYNGIEHWPHDAAMKIGTDTALMARAVKRFGKKA